MLDRVSLESEIVKMELHRDSCLLAIALQNHSLCVMDIVTRKIVRKFRGHAKEITDLAFSADSRWIITGSMDRTIKVWDVPTGASIYELRGRGDWYQLLSFSIIDRKPGGQCEVSKGSDVTVHVSQRGLFGHHSYRRSGHKLMDQRYSFLSRVPQTFVRRTPSQRDRITSHIKALHRRTALLGR